MMIRIISKKSYGLRTSLKYINRPVYRLPGLLPEALVDIRLIRSSPLYLLDYAADPFLNYLQGDPTTTASFDIFAQQLSEISAFDRYVSRYNRHELTSPEFSFLVQRVLPWLRNSFTSSTDVLRRFHDADDVRRKAKEYEIILGKPISSEHQSVSGYSLSMAQVEAVRYNKVYQSIKSKGYIRKGNCINGFLLKRRECSRVVIYDGMHKFYSLLALGATSIPVTFPSWPNTLNLDNPLPNLLDNPILRPTEILDLLNKIFDGFDQS